MSGLAEEELERSDASRWLRIAGGVLLIAVAVAVAVYLLQGLSKSGSPRQKQVTRITVLPDTPPPPPPPPPKEEPRETREVKQDQPKPVELPQEAPQQLKMEGEAGEGASPFAAGAVSRDYIGGKVGSGGGGGGGMQFAFFSNALQRHIQAELARNRKLKLGDYRVTVKVWLGADGVIRRAELAESTGNPDTDRALRAALTELGPLRTPVPDNLPQPIKLRITNRMTG